MSGYGENPYAQNYATGGGIKSGGGGGGGFMSTSQDTPSNKRSGSNSLRPLTIRQVLNAKQDHSDSEILIDGVEVVQLTIVGVVRSKNVFTTNVAYSIEDGTGQIDVKQWLEGSSDDSGRADGIEKDKYVRIIGQIKTFQGKKNISAGHIRPIEDPNEIMFHKLEAMYVHLELTRGSGGAGGDNPYQAGAGKANGAGFDGGDLGGLPRETLDSIKDTVQRQVLVQVNKLRGSDSEGVPISAVVRKLPALGEDRVQNAIQELLGEGFLFTAEDDQHVLPT